MAGLADSALQFLLDELTRALKEKVNLQRGVKQDIESVKEELEAMKAFLKFVDAKEEDDLRLQSWVERVRDVALDIEVVLDEFLLWIADGDDEDRQQHNTCLRSICPSIRKWKAKPHIGSELQTIKAKVKDIAEQPKKYGYCLPPNLYDQGSSSANASTREIDQFRRNALLVDESQLVGIDATKRELINWLLCDDPNLKVLAIVGMGGLGKTTLAKQICHDMKSQFTKHAFVTVSQSLKEDELLKDIVQQLFVG